MGKEGPTYNRRSIITILAVGIIILGIALASFALYRIQEQTTYAALPVYPTENLPVENVPTPNKILYPIKLIEGTVIGSLTIPALHQVFPIVEGTNVDDLKKGVGHFLQSVLPGENNNCVLSGHRDTVFKKLGSLKIGDQLITQTSAGTFTYVIAGTRIVGKDDRTVIVPKDHAVLTVTTCYPFIYVGDAPDRYIISADLVKN
jgi:sortase A